MEIQERGLGTWGLGVVGGGERKIWKGKAIESSMMLVQCSEIRK